MVISALDKLSGEKYAIKKIAKVFDNNEDAKRILREIILMKRFNHENIIKMVLIVTLAVSMVFYFVRFLASNFFFTSSFITRWT